MLNRIFGHNTHTYLHLLGLSGVAFGIPLNKVVMSISMMFLILNLVLEADFKNYWSNIKQNRVFHIILLFFSFSLISLLWTSNFEYAIHDFKAKLPLLVITTALVAKPLEKTKHLHLILIAFLSSTFLISMINFTMYQHWIGNRIYDDIRGMSIFSSHVRYALTVSFSIGILLYFLVEFKKYIVTICLLILWLTFYTYYSQVITGYLTLFGIIVVFLVYKLWAKNRIVVGTILILFIGAFSFTMFWLFSSIEINEQDYKGLPRQTAQGEYYTNQYGIISPITEKPIYILVCEPELRRDWPLYSELHFDSLDIKGQPVKSTIIRYLSSKDYPKDAEGLSKLTKKDIKSIENGNASYINTGIMARVYGVKFQLINETDPNDHSLLERIEYWKTGIKILSENFILGVGVGDTDDAFKLEYKNSDSMLTIENQRRSHNMFLSVFITLGIVGIILFIFWHIQFIRMNLKRKNVLAISFIVVALLSFLIEDTLETQTGITFYALFLGLFISDPQLKEKS